VQIVAGRKTAPLWYRIDIQPDFSAVMLIPTSKSVLQYFHYVLAVAEKRIFRQAAIELVAIASSGVKSDTLGVPSFVPK